MLEMNQMLRLVVERDASDLHISVNKPAVMRAGGTLDIVDPDILNPEDAERLMKEITPPRHQQILQEQGSADFAYSYSEQARFRVAIFRCRGAFSIVMRLIPSRILSFEDLGLNEGTRREYILQMLNAHRGLCLITGPTGSGKTTTLATLMNFINENRACHIITIEDPIEYTHKHKQCIVNQRELHIDTPSFSYALRGALRQDPDVILVGELRDLETMEAAITAAETGHLVFGTLHTISAAQTINRIIDAFPDEPAGADSFSYLGGAVYGYRANVAAAKRREGPHCRLRNHARDSRHPELDSRGQGRAHYFNDPDQRQIRHVYPGRLSARNIPQRIDQRRCLHDTLSLSKRHAPEADGERRRSCRRTGRKRNGRNWHKRD